MEPGAWTPARASARRRRPAAAISQTNPEDPAAVIGRTNPEDPPAAFLQACLSELRTVAGLGPVLDVACGRGRNGLAAAAAGLPTLGMDRNPEALRTLRDRARRRALPLLAVRADLETGRGIPVASDSCSAVLVFHFLHRPLAAELVRVLRPGGLLVYETFTTDQRALGTGPRRDAFLLAPGELPGLFPGLEVLRLDEGRREEAGRPIVTARLLAQRPGG